MSDYQIFEQQVGDWQCAVRYRVIDSHRLIPCPCYDVRWWVVENLETVESFMWAYFSDIVPDPKGYHPRLIAVDGKVEFYMPQKERTEAELDRFTDMVRRA